MTDQGNKNSRLSLVHQRNLRLQTSQPANSAWGKCTLRKKKTIANHLPLAFFQKARGLFKFKVQAQDLMTTKNPVMNSLEMIWTSRVLFKVIQKRKEARSRAESYKPCTRQNLHAKDRKSEISSFNQNRIYCRIPAT